MSLIIDHFRPTAAAAGDCLISVTPVAGGWSVQADGLAAPLMFISGAKAEAHARRLAERVAAAGRDARVLVHDRAGVLVGTVRCFADDPGGAIEPWRAGRQLGAPKDVKAA